MSTRLFSSEPFFIQQCVLRSRALSHNPVTSMCKSFICSAYGSKKGAFRLPFLCLPFTYRLIGRVVILIGETDDRLGNTQGSNSDGVRSIQPSCHYNLFIQQVVAFYASGSIIELHLCKCHVLAALFREHHVQLIAQ